MNRRAIEQKQSRMTRTNYDRTNDIFGRHEMSHKNDDLVKQSDSRKYSSEILDFNCIVDIRTFFFKHIQQQK